ncbi:hypothetical protein GCM10020295_07560 [Streptomyces cinereospinus]
MVSTLTGRPVTEELQDPRYWVRQVREPVRFADAVTALAEQGVGRFLEVGPDTVLAAMAEDVAPVGAHVVAAQRRDRDESRTLLTALGDLHTRGADVDFTALHPGGHHLDGLPTYPFQRQRYWADTREYWSSAWAGTGGGDVASAGLRPLAHPCWVRQWPCRTPVTSYSRAGSRRPRTRGRWTTPSWAWCCCRGPRSSRWRCTRALRPAARCSPN